MRKKIAFISLGCDKNRVDLEVVISAFSKSGFEIVNEEDAQVIVVNTCAFILDARKEAINTILEISKLKNKGTLKKIVVMGCLPEYEEIESLAYSLPEVDLFIKISEQRNIVQHVQALFSDEEIENNYKIGQRYLTTIGSHAYLKLSDGCNNCCSYCLIPKLRGVLKSRPLKNVLEEAKSLVKAGIKELILIAQDVTKYGLDLQDGDTNLENLLIELEKIKELKWIRLLYCYPDGISDNLISLIAKSKKICKYIDIPFQHVSDGILQNMHRRTSSEQIEKLIIKLRQKIPKIAIRTTFIVGFPGEKRKDFKKLCTFVKHFKLTNVGVFKFSKERGTMAALLKKQIPKIIKHARFKTLYRILENQQEDLMNAEIGKTLEMVCHTKLSGDLYEMRSEFNAPEIDNVIYVKSVKELIIGEFYNVKILSFDKKLKNLKGEITNEFTK